MGKETNIGETKEVEKEENDQKESSITSSSTSSNSCSSSSSSSSSGEEEDDDLKQEILHEAEFDVEHQRDSTVIIKNYKSNLSATNQRPYEPTFDGSDSQKLKVNVTELLSSYFINNPVIDDEENEHEEDSKTTKQNHYNNPTNSTLEIQAIINV